jgi:hypothetical protein
MKLALSCPSPQKDSPVIGLKSHEFADDVKQTLGGTAVDEMVAVDYREICEELEVSS